MSITGWTSNDEVIRRIRTATRNRDYVIYLVNLVNGFRTPKATALLLLILSSYIFGGVSANAPFQGVTVAAIGAIAFGVVLVSLGRLESFLFSVLGSIGTINSSVLLAVAFTPTATILSCLARVIRLESFDLCFNPVWILCRPLLCLCSNLVWVVSFPFGGFLEDAICISLVALGSKLATASLAFGMKTIWAWLVLVEVIRGSGVLVETTSTNLCLGSHGTHLCAIT